MEKHTLDHDEYLKLLREIKERIHSAQHLALKMVNRELISLYWDIGRMIVERQKDERRGQGFFIILIQKIKNSHRWCEKSVGLII